MKWTTQDKQLLKTNMTTEQIAEATGRTHESIKRARYSYTGHSVEASKAIETKEEKLFEAERKYRKLKREENLINLCEVLGVRIGGMYDRTV